MPVVAALASDTEAGRDLAVLLATPGPLTEQELLRAAELVEGAGGRGWTENRADDALALAVGYLTEADMPPDLRAEFRGIAEFITARQW